MNCTFTIIVLFLTLVFQLHAAEKKNIVLNPDLELRPISSAVYIHVSYMSSGVSLAFACRS